MVAVRDVPNNDPTEVARLEIAHLLNGGEPRVATLEGQGSLSELYGEMVRAYDDGGTPKAREVFLVYAELDASIAALRATDPLPPKISWGADELLKAEFTTAPWSIPKLLPPGLVIFAGRPKQGKSWLSLQIAEAVGSGGVLFNQPASWGPVLYLALEDNSTRIQERLRIQGMEPGAQIDFHFAWEPLTEHGLTRLEEAIDGNHYNVVIIDTLSRWIGPATQKDQASLNQQVAKLQRLAIERNVTVLCIDHHRKGNKEGGDVIDDVMGATFKMGAVDAAWGLYRERGQPVATLKIAGRDVADTELTLAWEEQRCRWQLADADGDEESSSGM